VPERGVLQTGNRRDPLPPDAVGRGAARTRLSRERSGRRCRSARSGGRRRCRPGGARAAPRATRTRPRRCCATAEALVDAAHGRPDQDGSAAAAKRLRNRGDAEDEQDDPSKRSPGANRSPATATARKAAALHRIARRSAAVFRGVCWTSLSPLAVVPLPWNSRSSSTATAVESTSPSARFEASHRFRATVRDGSAGDRRGPGRLSTCPARQATIPSAPAVDDERTAVEACPTSTKTTE
jgi:hypothetical protein